MKLTGKYTRAGAYLNSPDLVLIIGTRRKPTPHKPQHYLLAKGEGGATTKDLWISSIYPVPDKPALYGFDYKGKQYRLAIDSDHVTIEQAG
jgi:hypothetical protein